MVGVVLIGVVRVGVVVGVGVKVFNSWLSEQSNTGSETETITASSCFGTSVEVSVRSEISKTRGDINGDGVGIGGGDNTSKVTSSAFLDLSNFALPFSCI